MDQANGESAGPVIDHPGALDYTPEAYRSALDKWKAEGGVRPAKRPDGVPTRIDMNWMTRAEDAIIKAQEAVEQAGGSQALTDAVVLLQKARERVADHVEGHGAEPVA